MRFQTELVPATLIKRYKRFLADCRLEDGREITAHCANPGSMMGLAEPGTRIWLEPNDDPKKKLKFGWRLVQLGDDFVGVDTSIPNKALKLALTDRKVERLSAYSNTRAEVRYGASSRIDFLLTEPGLPDCYVEVKSVTLSRAPGLAEFPDCVTTRGAKHLDELAAMRAAGHRAVMLYLVQRTDAQRFALASDVDPAYAAAYARASAVGVETLVLRTNMSQDRVEVGPELPL